MVIYIGFGLILFAVSAILVSKFINLAGFLNIIDIPNSRSSHGVPTVRGGGIIICVLSAILIALLYGNGYLNLGLAVSLSCCCVVSVIGFLDDVVQLTIKFRLLMQLLVSVIAVVSIIPVDDYFNILNILLLLSASIFLVWSTNLFNFMDGIDGFASVEAVFVLSVGGGLLFVIAGDCIFSGLLWAISCITLGFLWFNLPPAKIFMGDAGSYFLGFLIAVSALISHFIFNVSIVFWLIIYSVFLFDATITLARRFLTGEQWYLSHRSHAYQRLQDIGWQHRDILYGLAAVNCLLLSLVILGYYNKLLWSGILALIGLAIIYLLVEFKIKIYEKNT